MSTNTLLSLADDNTFWFFFKKVYLDSIAKYNNYII